MGPLTDHGAFARTISVRMVSRVLFLSFLCLAPVSQFCWAEEQAETEAEAPVTLTPDTDGVQRAVVTLDSYSYSPAHLVVQVGKPVELTLKSVTVITPHNFILKEPEAGLDIEQAVGAGETSTVQFMPTQAGVFTIYCDKKLLFFPSHREKGMEGRLEVRE